MESKQTMKSELKIVQKTKFKVVFLVFPVAECLYLGIVRKLTLSPSHSHHHRIQWLRIKQMGQEKMNNDKGKSDEICCVYRPLNCCGCGKLYTDATGRVLTCRPPLKTSPIRHFFVVYNFATVNSGVLRAERTLIWSYMAKGRGCSSKSSDDLTIMPDQRNRTRYVIPYRVSKLAIANPCYRVMHYMGWCKGCVGGSADDALVPAPRSCRFLRTLCCTQKHSLWSW